MMKTINVRLNKDPYEIIIGNSFNGLGQSVQKMSPSNRALIVTHGNLLKLYGSSIQKSLTEAGIKCKFYQIPIGEKTKNLSTVHQIYRACLKSELDRRSCIIALGGGVVGDIAGFGAATFLRGIPLIQVPTTLLAMVDSSIGGKTGVDLREAKNYVGSIYQPRLVWVNQDTLKTLPKREFINGMAEVIKYGVIADFDLFKTLEAHVPLSNPKAQSILTSVICQCANIKARVVAQDERETKGVREILNFGHTWGHAVETNGNYNTYSHGQAISIGMCAAGRMANQLGLWKNEDLSRMEDLLLQTGLPLKLSRPLPPKALFKILLKDKKNRQGKLRFVLPVKIGKVIVKEVSTQTALEGLKYVQP